jgi:hypothetical protein
MSSAIQKTYFPISPTNFPLTNDGVGKIEITLPSFFTNSMNNDKFIEVRHCKVIYKTALVNDVKLHSDIVKEYAFDDHFICFTNEVLVKPKKFKWMSSNKVFDIWFTDIRNNPIEIIDYHVREYTLVFVTP